MRRTPLLLLFATFILLQTSVILADTTMTGIVVGKRADAVKITYQPTQNVAPANGDKVEFFTEFDGFEVAAGVGVVTKVETQFIWVKINDDRPELDMKVVIQATGETVKLPKVVTSDSDYDSGFGWEEVTTQTISPEENNIASIVAANESCDYFRAKQLADETSRSFPNNAWLRQNYATIETLARRSTNYQTAINSAYLNLENGKVAESIEFMKRAMQNASVQCGQDKQVMSLLEQAKMIAKMEREQAIEQARRETVSSASENQRYRAELEKKRASDKAFGQALHGNLLGLLKSINSSAKPTFPNTTTIQETDREMTSRMARDTERNNSDILNKWRKSQGWKTVPKPPPKEKKEDDSGW